ncbi:MAG: hypothetical protein ACOCPR_05440 [Guyparkeria sp.]
MTPHLLQTHAIAPALDLLPEKMQDPRARRLLAAIALQESGLRHRRQVGGPARGWWQFEVAGVIGVLDHPDTGGLARDLAGTLGYPDPEPAKIYRAIEHHDPLAAGIARLLIWTLPHPLPESREEAWQQYIDAWRPGRPRPEHWTQAWQTAQAVMES